MPTWLGFAWTSPNTLIGLVLGLLTFQLPVVRDGAVIFDKTPRGLTWLMPRLNRSAMTVGFVILSAEPVTGRLLAHERWHIRQFCAWGPLFIPVYFLLAIAFGYRRHPMEIRAQLAAGERAPARPDLTHQWDSMIADATRACDRPMRRGRPPTTRRPRPR